MSVHNTVADPGSVEILLDDGMVLIFKFSEASDGISEMVTGFPHRPLSAAETLTSGNPSRGLGPCYIYFNQRSRVVGRHR
jgi:hypothetical protein